MDALKTLLFVAALFIGVIVWGNWIIYSHPQNSIVSWDEGFHGGAALFISESLKDSFSFQKYTYILNDFKNGAIWYPPLWLFLAGPLGALFGPSVEIYRFTTLIFAIFSIFLLSLFVKSESDTKAGIITAITIMFVPVFVVYSHLMMREVPLLFAVSFALLLFYKYLTKKRLSKMDLIVTTLAFGVGALAKIIGIVLIFSTVLIFGVVLYLFYRKEIMWQRFNSKWTVYFLIFSTFTFLLYRHFTIFFLNADPLLFHIDQTKGMSGGVHLLTSIFKSLENFRFYSNDFSHMPALSAFWFGSAIAYIVSTRSPLAYFLLIWMLITYFVFSGVKPQSVQYVMSIFAPISILAGLFWGEFLRYRNKVVGNFLFIIIPVLIIWLSLVNLERTETIVWRNTITYQSSAANFVAEYAAFGDRIITTGDGTRFLARLAGFDRKLQTVNGAAHNCPEFIQDSVEWAILDNGPQSPVKLNEIRSPNWIIKTKFPTPGEETIVLKNTNQTNEVNLENEDFINLKCVRIFPLGRSEINFFLTTYATVDITEGLKISLKINPLKTFKELVVIPEDLIKNSGKEQIYRIEFEQTQINKPIYIYFDIPKNLQITAGKIQIKNLSKI